MTSTDKWIMKEHILRKRASSSPVFILSWILVFVILGLAFGYFWAF